MNMIKLRLRFTTYMLTTMNINEMLKRVLVEARLFLNRALHVGKITLNLTNIVSGKIEVLSSCTKLVCCLARSLELARCGSNNHE